MASPRSMQRAGRRSRRSEDDLPHPHRETVAADDADGDQRPDPEGEGEEGENLGAAHAGGERGGGLDRESAVAGKRWAVRVVIGGRSIITKKKINKTKHINVT